MAGGQWQQRLWSRRSLDGKASGLWAAERNLLVRGRLHRHLTLLPVVWMFDTLKAETLYVRINVSVKWEECV